MQFVNHTPSPALAFMGVDQRGQQFHVVVVRQTLTWDETGQLMFCDAQPSLCEADQFFDGDIHSSVQEESDLCPYKPRCDVIVNATAHAPRGSNESLSKQFQVRLVVKRPEDPLMVKRESWASASQEIDLLMSSRSQDAVKTVSWDRHVDKSSERVPPLIDKTLTVTGKRCFVKGALAAEGESGSCWSLTEAEPVCALPVCLERAFGGQCRIGVDDIGADKVSKEHQLAPEQRQVHPEANPPPLAHEALGENPVGKGFVRDWYVEATDTQSVEAPQIEYPQRPITVEYFERVRVGETESAQLMVAGLGVRPKGHPDRTKLAGTIDEAFIKSNAPLPRDFDFAVWNAGWPDQQVDALMGDELIELTNLCAPDMIAASRNERGDTVLRLALPRWQPYVLIRFASGQLAPAALDVDTLIVSPDSTSVAMVYRAIFAVDPPIRCIEARLMPRDQWQAAMASDHAKQASRSQAQTADTVHG